ncbi:hypothetical protein GCM10009715_10280 [Paeniglutamicibacter psychrophenolicus]|uniref:Uncharacterized protein n=1 Tax=Paeniglutamicibacter psychrophenolicus TaxID=257454 RepID=A0ABS4WHV7_9MICC|nr:hypothetical protein [Paeniglutamicibacter psychrophenolicus]MBP2375129.1 hypothetical protein [Paeniglutamicibacter psychrophenolicus]
MPTEDDAAKAEFAARLEAEEAKARTEMRSIRILWVLAAATLALAVVLWVGFGGRDQYIARSSGYDAQVLLPAWLALAGLLSAAAATVLGVIRLMRGALGNILQKQARK